MACLGEAALACGSTVGVFARSVLDQVAPALEQSTITQGILRRAGAAVEALTGHGTLELFQESARDAVARISADLRRFADDEPAVVINVASTEP